jgi:hypothetical protein
MSHPKDRRERFLIGKNKGNKRGYRYWNGFNYIKDPDEREELMAIASYKRRNTTKLCSCHMCANPRRGPWKGKDKLTMQEKKFREKFKSE